MQAQRLSWSKVEAPLQKLGLALARITLGLLFFTQLWWKVPPSFGCPPDFAFATADASGAVHRTSGLCDWIGIESIYSTRSHPILAADLHSIGGPALKLDVGFLSAGNGVFIDKVVKPNIRVFGFFVWGMEAFIFVTLFLGLFTRLGALVAILQSLQLWVGLAGVAGEWEWSYNWMPVLALLIFAFAPQISFGLDSWLRPRLKPAADKGSRVSQILLWLM